MVPLMTREQVENVLIGVSFDCLDQFRQMVDRKAEIIANHEVCSLNYFRSKLKELTKTYRLLIGSVHKANSMKTETTLPDEYLMTAMPTIWNSLILLFDQALSQQQDQFDQKAE